MRKRFGVRVVSALILLLSLSAVAQQRNRPAAQRPPANSDLTIKYRATIAGQTTESTSMIKGARERTETQTAYAGNQINITQCDQKRFIQISERTRKYLVTPMQTQSATQATAAPVSSSGPTRRGGVVTYITTATDTGERKEMFGFIARHVKTSMQIESSPDACNQIKQRTETDGWYIDFAVAFSCELGRPPVMPNRGIRPDCQDQTEFRRVGTAKTGYPLVETTTMYGPDGTVTFTTTKEVVELSHAPLDAALFDIPAGYTEAQSAQELYAPPSAETMAGEVAKQDPGARPEDPQAPASDPKSAGAIRVGVVPLNNKTERTVSTQSLRDRLIGEIRSAGIEAIPLNAETQTAAEAEARIKGCDFILYTDISSLKLPKVGGMFGRVTGITAGAKTESRLDFKLFAVGEASPRLQSSATGKEEGDEASAGIAVTSEARMVVSAVKSR